jgi:hypothetical protein
MSQKLAWRDAYVASCLDWTEQVLAWHASSDQCGSVLMYHMTLHAFGQYLTECMNNTLMKLIMPITSESHQQVRARNSWSCTCWRRSRGGENCGWTA